MRETHETGAPVMRTLFYEFPGDKTCWEVEDEYYVRRQVSGGSGSGGRRKKPAGVPSGGMQLAASGQRPASICRRKMG